jgi:hypothetical protein
MKFYVFKDEKSGEWRWTNWAGCADFADTQREAFEAALADLALHYSMEATA